MRKAAGADHMLQASSHHSIGCIMNTSAADDDDDVASAGTNATHDAVHFICCCLSCTFAR
jgi:hypothetical protein